MEMDARVFCIPRREGFVIILPTCLYWQQKGPNFKDGAGFIYGPCSPFLDSRKGLFFGTNRCFGPKFGILVWRHQMKMYPKKHKTASSSNLLVASAWRSVSHCFKALWLSPSGRTWKPCTAHKIHKKSVQSVWCIVCNVHHVLDASYAGCM